MYWQLHCQTNKRIIISISSYCLVYIIISSCLYRPVILSIWVSVFYVVVRPTYAFVNMAHNELKARVNLSGCLTSVVCLTVYPFVSQAVLLYLNLSHSHILQNQRTLTQNILGWRKFKFVQMKGQERKTATWWTSVEDWKSSPELLA